MRIIQPLFSARSPQPTGLGDSNFIFDARRGLHQRIETDIDLGQTEFLLFYVPDHKLKEDNNFEQQYDAVAGVKDHFPDIRLNVDVCLCSYTEDGHCCVTGEPNKTEDLLQEQATLLQKAGADSAAPSDCQPNTVKNIKENLNIHVMSYSTKFRSLYYKNWRDVMGIEKGIFRSYQLDVDDREGAIQASIKYSNDGANELMVKPGITGLDLIHEIKEKTGRPVGAYQTSGEWMGIMNDHGILEETYEIFKRAGTDYLITYGARQLLNK